MSELMTYSLHRFDFLKDRTLSSTTELLDRFLWPSKKQLQTVLKTRGEKVSSCFTQASCGTLTYSLKMAKPDFLDESWQFVM